MKNSDKNVLSQFLFSFGFFAAFLFFVFPEIKEFDRMTKLNFRVAEGIFLFLSFLAYMNFLIFRSKKFHIGRILVQGLIVLALLLSIAHSDTKFFKAFHIGMYPISMIAWTAYMLLQRSDEKMKIKIREYVPHEH